MFIMTFFFILYIPILLIKYFQRLKTTFNISNFNEQFDDKFENLYNELYEKHIAVLEEKRKIARFTTIVEYIIAGLFLIGYVFSESEYIIISKSIDSKIEGLSIILFFIWIGMKFFNSKKIKEYKKNYKEKIVKSFIDLLKKDITYNQEELSDTKKWLDIYKYAEFDTKSFNRFSSDDCIEGYIDNEVYAKIADLEIKNVTGSGRNKSVVIRFEGLFAVTNCKTNFKSPVKISKNAVQLLKSVNAVELDNEAFERFFDVYSEDKILAVRILTHDVMECLLDFYQKYKIKYELVFKGQVINIRFYTGPMFEPKIFGSSMDKELLYVYYLILKFVIDLTKTVNKELQNFEI